MVKFRPTESYPALRDSYNRSAFIDQELSGSAINSKLILEVRQHELVKWMTGGKISVHGDNHWLCNEMGCQQMFFQL
jgi:hypothetical protein